MPMRVTNSKAVTFICALWIWSLSGCGASTPPAQHGIQFVAEDIYGSSVSLSDYDQSKIVFVSFFASWCEPCKDEMRFLQTIHKEYFAQGVTVISVSIDDPESQEDVKTQARATGYDYPVLIDTEGEASAALNPLKAVPFNVILKQGEIVWRHEGFVPSDEPHIEQALMDALK